MTNTHFMVQRNVLQCFLILYYLSNTCTFMYMYLLYMYMYRYIYIDICTFIYAYYIYFKYAAVQTVFEFSTANDSSCVDYTYQICWRVVKENLERISHFMNIIVLRTTKMKTSYSIKLSLLTLFLLLRMF